MLIFIILGILAAVFAVSVIAVITEYLMPKNTGFGRVLRAVRIRLREFSFTSFCVISAVLLVFGLAAHYSFVWLSAAIGIMLLTLAVLHPEDFTSIFRQRKSARKKTHLGLTPLLAAETPLAKISEELPPIVVDADSAEGKE